MRAIYRRVVGLPTLPVFALVITASVPEGPRNVRAALPLSALHMGFDGESCGPSPNAGASFRATTGGATSRNGDVDPTDLSQLLAACGTTCAQ